MLVLNRKVGESIILDDDIEIYILEEKDGKIKLGIEAPDNVTILRREVYEEVRQENTNSTKEKDIDIREFLKNNK